MSLHDVLLERVSAGMVDPADRRRHGPAAGHDRPRRHRGPPADPDRPRARAAAGAGGRRHRLRVRAVRLLAVVRRAHDQRADGRRRGADPAAVRDAVPPRGRASCSTPCGTCSGSRTRACGCWACCRPCSTPARPTPGRSWPTSGSATGCRCSTRRSPSRSGSRRRPATGRSVLATATEARGAESYRELARQLVDGELVAGD